MLFNILTPFHILTSFHILTHFYILTPLHILTPFHFLTGTEAGQRQKEIDTMKYLSLAALGRAIS